MYIIEYFLPQFCFVLANQYHFVINKIVK